MTPLTFYINTIYDIERASWSYTPAQPPSRASYSTDKGPRRALHPSSKLPLCLPSVTPLPLFPFGEEKCHLTRRQNISLGLNRGGLVEWRGVYRKRLPPVQLWRLSKHDACSVGFPGASPNPHSDSSQKNKITLADKSDGTCEVELDSDACGFEGSECGSLSFVVDSLAL